MTDTQIGWRGRPQFDRSTYDQLNEQTGGTGDEILAVVRQVLPVRKDAMLRAVVDGNGKELARLAHMAKSGSFSLGLLRLGSLCEMIERKVAAGQVELTEFAPAITGEFDAAIALLDAFAQE